MTRKVNSDLEAMFADMNGTAPLAAADAEAAVRLVRWFDATGLGTRRTTRPRP